MTELSKLSKKANQNHVNVTCPPKDKSKPLGPIARFIAKAILIGGLAFIAYGCVKVYPYLFTGGMRLYTLLYLAGYALAAVLMLVKGTLLLTIDWLTKADILKANAAKIAAPDIRSSKEKTLGAAIVILILAVPSWIVVPVILWQIFQLPFLALRVRLSLAYMPESMKQYMFPLLTNRDLSREVAWAYSRAYGVKNGDILDDCFLVYELDKLFSYYPSFERTLALRRLETLNVVEPEIIAEALEQLNGDSRKPGVAGFKLRDLVNPCGSN